MSSARRRDRKSRYGAADDRNQPQISHSHFLGYVLEDETPEMIMKKFEALARFEEEQKQRAAAPGEKGAKELTEEQARQLYVLTSNIDIRSFSVEEEEAKLFGDESGTLEAKQEPVEMEVEENQEFWDDVEDVEEPLKKKKPNREDRKEPSSKPPPRAIVESIRLPDSSRVVFKKKSKTVHPLAISFTRIPPFPVSLSWGKMIKPYVRPENLPPTIGSRYIECDIRGLDLETIVQSHLSFQGILMDPPWYDSYSKEEQPYAIRPSDLLKLNLTSKVIQDGFIFIWIEKSLVPDVIDSLGSVGFNIVENMAWVRLQPNNRPIQEPSPYFSRSKLTLYFFRKIVPPTTPNYKPIELRHQRNPDIIFDQAKKKTGLTDPKPDFVYDMIETLLPTANLNPETKEGRLLELWSQKGCPLRPGWTLVSQATNTSPCASNVRTPVVETKLDEYVKQNPNESTDMKTSEFDEVKASESGKGKPDEPETKISEPVQEKIDESTVVKANEYGKEEENKPETETIECTETKTSEPAQEKTDESDELKANEYGKEEENKPETKTIQSDEMKVNESGNGKPDEPVDVVCKVEQSHPDSSAASEIIAGDTQPSKLCLGDEQNLASMEDK